jgi:tetratricopeptide (TPR) repeat protein
VANLTGEQDLGWVRVGLMSLLARMLEENGVDVVPERTVLAALADQEIDAPPDRDTFDDIRKRSGADSVLFTSLRERGGLHRLAAVLTRPDGRQIRRLMTGDSPAELAAQLAEIVAGVLTTAPDEAAGRFSKVSTDPFVNELYARALDLELEGRLEDARETFRVAAAQEPELFWLRYEIALCTRDLREFDEAAEMFVELYAEADNGGDARAKIVTLNSHGIMLFKLNRYDEAEQKYLAALDIAAEREMPDETATVLVNLALVNTRQGDLATARRYYDRALDTYADQGRPPSGYLLNNYAGLLLEVGDLAAARVHSEAAVTEFRQRGQRRFEAPSLNRLAKIMRRQGDLDGALERHRQALDIYRDLGDTGGVLSVRSAMTNVYRIRGDFTRASNNAVEVLERARQTDEPLLVAQAHLDYGRLLTDAGRFAEATEHLEQALGIFLDSGEVPGAQTARAELAAAKLESGEISEALDIAVGLRADALAAGNLAAESHANVLLGRVALADGDRDAAHDRFGAALASARTGGDPESTSIAGLALAELSLADGRVDDAVELIEEIRPFAAGRIDFRRLDARVALALGDVDRAAAIMGELRRQAGEAWTAEDEALLVDLQERAGG